MPSASELERMRQENEDDMQRVSGDAERRPIETTAVPTRDQATADIQREMQDFDEGRLNWPGVGEFEKELENLINRYGMERAGGDTPDFILARYLRMQLDIFHATVRRRESWHGRDEKLVERRMEMYNG